MESQPPVHVFLVSYPGQGHINPLLRLGKILASKGLLVTFSTTENIGIQMRKANNVSEEPIPVGNGMIRFEFFDDGLTEDDQQQRLDIDLYLPQLELAGKKALTQILKRHEQEGRPVTCLINNPFLPWVSDLAEILCIPSAMFWVQSCASFSAYFHYYHSLVPFPSEDKPEIDVQLPNMPLLKYDEFPSFLHPTTAYPVLRRAILSQFKNLSKPFCILVETFQELEDEVIKYMAQLCPIKPVGPLFKYPITGNCSTITGDFFKADDCIEWLNSMDPSSVVYISFGTVAYLKQEQVNELAYGLFNSGVKFLWVMRLANKDFGVDPIVLPDGFLEKVNDRGKVVQWCPQDQVLAHPSVACFVSHCGWNSSMEALSSGVPVVTFPQWGDQVTNAKYLVDEFKVGIRLYRGVAENKIVSREEVEKCLREATSGQKAVEMKENALKWKKSAGEAVAVGGSSDRNILDFVDNVRSVCVTLKT